eukprot:3513475-Amphidinium_carterae.1
MTNKSSSPGTGPPLRLQRFLHKPEVFTRPKLHYDLGDRYRNNTTLAYTRTLPPVPLKCKCNLLHEALNKCL